MIYTGILYVNKSIIIPNIRIHLCLYTVMRKRMYNSFVCTCFLALTMVLLEALYFFTIFRLKRLVLRIDPVE